MDLLPIALDLCANLAAEDRYRRLMEAVRRLVPCDSAALLRLQDGVLVPVAVSGLVPDTVGRRFLPAEHPRLQRFLHAGGVVRFIGADLPDPFDGLLSGPGWADPYLRVHACMGCPLLVAGETIGVLAMDALDLHAFDGLDDHNVATLAALAGAAVRTAGLIDALEQSAARKDLVTRQLLRDAQQLGGELLGQSPALRSVRDEIGLLAGAELTVLITGETGVGKEVVARALHAQSPRRDQPLIYVNCAALPESIAESELFGHVRGAFTGATDRRAGKFEVADRGTLFLDEIGELPLSIQPKLLRALQSGEIQRVGADQALRVDVRVLAATNRDLQVEVRAGRFRADLFHRLSVYPLYVPPLRERDGDVLLLAGFFLDAARARLGLGPVRLTQAAQGVLRAYDWPGNVRELEHLLLRAALRAAAGRRAELVVIEEAHLGLEGPRTAPLLQSVPEAARQPPEIRPLAEAVDEVRRTLILEAVARCANNWAEAARRLGMDRGNLHRLARRLGLTDP